MRINRMHGWVGAVLAITLLLGTGWLLVQGGDPGQASAGAECEPTATDQSASNHPTLKPRASKAGEPPSPVRPTDADASAGTASPVPRRAGPGSNRYEWLAEMRRARDTGGLSGLAELMRTWRENPQGDLPRRSALLVNEATAEFFAGRRAEAGARLAEAVVDLAPQKRGKMESHPTLFFLAAPAAALPASGPELDSLSTEGARWVASDVNFVYLWKHSLGLTDDGAWNEYIRWLSELALDRQRPQEALAACIWLHALYLHSFALFPLHLPPAAVRLIERHGGSPATLAAELNRASGSTNPFFAYYQRALDAGDQEALALREEFERANRREDWLRLQSVGVWSLEMEIKHRFDGIQEPAEAVLLHDLALTLVR